MRRRECPFTCLTEQHIRNELEQFARKLQVEREYKEVRTPFIMNQRLWEQSGHWDHYHENMYFTEVDDNKFALKADELSRPYVDL